MKGWVVRDKGLPKDVFHWEDFPEPTHAAMATMAMDIEGLRPRRDGEPAVDHYAFVRVLAAALATPDHTMATGHYPAPVVRPYVSGQEAVGIVEDATESLRHLIGKRVMGFTPQPFGSFASHTVMALPTIWEVPEAMSDEDAAGFVIPAHTAYHAVHRRGKVQAGENVLVLGAAGGVPSSAVQLCAAAGCRVIAVARGADKVDYARKLGAAIAIDSGREDFVAAVKRAVGENAIDVIVDFVQGEPGRLARPLLRVEGRHLLCGHAGGLIPIHPTEFYVQNWTLVGVCMGSGYGPKLMEIEQKAHDDLMALVRAGRYRATTTRVIRFDEIPSALEDLADRKTFGRVVAKP
jgi:NADPH2:quinone reductase